MVYILFLCVHSGEKDKKECRIVLVRTTSFFPIFELFFPFQSHKRCHTKNYPADRSSDGKNGEKILLFASNCNLLPHFVGDGVVLGAQTWDSNRAVVHKSEKSCCAFTSEAGEKICRRKCAFSERHSLSTEEHPRYLG